MGVGGQRHAQTASLPVKTRYPLYRRLGGHQGRSRRVRKISPPTGIRSPDRPTRSESPYRLNYPGPHIHDRRKKERKKEKKRTTTNNMKLEFVAVAAFYKIFCSNGCFVFCMFQFIIFVNSFGTYNDISWRSALFFATGKIVRVSEWRQTVSSASYLYSAYITR
jgi:hypothetical protein